MARVLINSGEPLTTGDDWVFTITLQRDGVAVNVTGATVTASLWQWAPVKQLAIAAHAVTLTTAASGIVTLTITDTENAGLVEGTYRGDLKVVYSDATVEHFGEYYELKVRSPLT